MRPAPVFLAILLAGCAGPEPTPTPQPPLELAGRSAGTPERCVTMQAGEALRVSDNDPHTLLYGNGRTIWANHLAGCGFRRDDVLVTQPIGSSYCRGDLVRSIDRLTKIQGPACVIGDFVPYTR